jgi:hypothetical protein
MQTRDFTSDFVHPQSCCTAFPCLKMDLISGSFRKQMSLSICRTCAQHLRSKASSASASRRLLSSSPADRLSSYADRTSKPRFSSRERPSRERSSSYTDRSSKPPFSSRERSPRVPRERPARTTFSKWTERPPSGEFKPRSAHPPRSVQRNSAGGFKPRTSFVPQFAGRPSRGSLQNIAARAGQPLDEEVDLDEDEAKVADPTQWRRQKAALKRILDGQTWNPTRKKLSPDTMDGIRAMHQAYPETLTTPVLAKHFEISPEAIRRILKSKWKPTEEEEEKRMARWEKRGKEVWERLVREKGYKPPKKWRDLGVQGPRKDGEEAGASNELFRMEETSRAPQRPRFAEANPRPEAVQRGAGMSNDAWWEENVMSTIKSPAPSHSRAVPEL